MRYAAFLRAINVGGRVVKMERLRALFGSLGLHDVETVIASGNVLFTSAEPDRDALVARIETGLRDALGYDVPTFLRNAPQLEAVIAHNAFDDATLATAGAVTVGFLARDPSAKERVALLAHATDFDLFHSHAREVWWLVRGRQSDSKINLTKLERSLGQPSTFRNVTTVRKIAAALGG